MKPRKGTSLVRATVDDFIYGDGYDSGVFGTTGDPYPSLALAAAAWESTFRKPAWEAWARETVFERGTRRGPFLHPPGGAVTHDQIGERASRVYWPQKDADPQSAVDACDADLASIEAFRKSRPNEAKAIAGPLDVYISQIVWFKNAALRAGTDYELGTQLVYGHVPVVDDDGDDD